MQGRFGRFNFAVLFPASEQEKTYSMVGGALGLLLAGVSITSDHLSNAAKILYLFALPLAGYGSGIGVSRIKESANQNTTDKSENANTARPTK